MALVITPSLTSPPLVVYEFNVTGLTLGVNAISLPTTFGAFPQDTEWTPTMVEAFGWAIGAIGPFVNADLDSIVNTAGVITFNLYASDAGNARIRVY